MLNFCFAFVMFLFLFFLFHDLDLGLGVLFSCIDLGNFVTLVIFVPMIGPFILLTKFI
jgi:hypothetical protein